MMRFVPPLVTIAAGLVATVTLHSCTVPGVPGSTDRFHLVGAHREAACSACHTDGLERGLPNTCSGCHEDTRPPDHYPGDCGECHTATHWMDIQVDHDQWLPLHGGHDGLACTDCHLPGTFEGLDAACATCHEPDRPAGHFTGSCETCHNVSRWDDADFDHSGFFPLPHGEGVRRCEQCHLQDDGYQTFSCIDCHEHNQTDTARQHREVSRYVWESTACLDCHPRGREDDGS